MEVISYIVFVLCIGFRHGGDLLACVLCVEPFRHGGDLLGGDLLVCVLCVEPFRHGGDLLAVYSIWTWR